GEVAQLRKKPGGFGGSSHRLVAAVDLQRPCRINRGQAIGLVKLPAVNKAVVARSALEVDTQQRLPNALGELNLDGLAGTDFAPPANALNKSCGFRRGRGNQLASEQVVRLVGD